MYYRLCGLSLFFCLTPNFWGMSVSKLSTHTLILGNSLNADHFPNHFHKYVSAALIFFKVLGVLEALRDIPTSKDM